MELSNMARPYDPEITGQVRPIPVAYLLHTIAYGGIETVILNWIEAMDTRRYQIHLICFANPGETEAPFVEAARQRGIQVDKIPWSRRKPLFKAARTLAGIIRDKDIRILHTHGWYAEFTGLLTAWLVPVKTLTTVYVWFDYDWRRNLIQWLDQYVIRYFDQVTAHCEYTRRDTIARGIPEAEIRTLICGYRGQPYRIDDSERHRLRAEQGLADEHVVLVNVARFYPEKTHAALLRIFQHVHREVPATRLWLVGTGPLEEALRRQVAELGLEQVVRFTGFVSDLPRLLSLTDMQVHPAAIEGVPLAVLAGMSAGLPIVASAVGGLPEILADGRNGVLVEGGDEAAFVRAVLSLLADPQRTRSLGQRTLEFVRTEYSLDAAVTQVADCYDALLAKR